MWILYSTSRRPSSTWNVRYQTAKYTKDNMCGDKWRHESRKLHSHTINTSNNHSCRANRTPHNGTDKVYIHDNNTNMTPYFRSSANKATDKRASQYNKFNYVFLGIYCFKGTFCLQVKAGNWPHQTSPGRVAYALQIPLEEKLERLKGGK